ncbi:MAG: SPFH domain-containing protein [Clostridia bacterium]|nr:SPFH domain-containing protein [Clostridia bacterium]
MNISKLSKEELITQLNNEQIDVNELNLNVLLQREAYFEAIKIRPSLLTKVSGANERHFLLPAIEKNPVFFVYLDKKQYTNELAQLYLEYRLNESSKKPNKVDEVNGLLIAQKSMDNKVVLNYSYATNDGEELYYYDNELEVPASIKSYFKATLKIVDALALIKKLDLHITQLGENKVKATIKDIFDNQYKAYLSKYISKQKIGYYTLCTTLYDFEEFFQNKMSDVFKSYGIELTDFIIKKLAIPKDIQYKIEDQAFKIRQLRADNEANNEFAKKSLENYEKKLSIQEKYPEAEHSLTEYEKDLALKRYLIKKGRQEVDNINRNIDIDKAKDLVDSAINKKEEAIIPEKKNPFRVAYFTMLIICASINFILLFVVPGPALIVLGILTAIFGLIGGLCYEKLKKPENKTEVLVNTPNSVATPVQTQPDTTNNVEENREN